MNLDDPHRETHEDELFQVTAMVDVVFILLAFFVLSVQFHGGERDLTVGHKQAGPPTGASRDDFPPEIVVRMKPGADGEVRLTLGERRLRDDGYGELTAALAAIDMPNIPVVLAADPTLTVQQVAGGLDAILASPAERVSLSPLVTERAP